MPSPLTRLIALQFVFAMNALGLSVWFPRIPDVKAALGLDILTLSLCLFAMPVGTMVGFLTVNRVVHRAGLKATATWGGAAFLVSFIGPALARDAATLGLALFVCGLSIASIEVAMNAKASQMEAALQRRVMTRCHAFWSFGTVIGALIGGAFAQADASFLQQQLLLQPLFAAATILAGWLLIPDAPRAPAPSRGFAVPSAALLLLCLAPLGALLIEGAMMEWSALLLREHVGASPFVTAATFSVFALAMACGRLAGDRLAEAFGAGPVILASTLAMAAAILGFALSREVWLSMPFAALVGLGCANVYPLTMSMVAPLPGQPPEKNVATLALTAFTAFLIGPPFIGLMASVVGLPAALALLAPVGPAALLARVAAGRRQ
ncbi:MFS transporter [Amaricoccus sp.]|uniref:MFS transporter n=1 Tax=Amaricoccus sp. TaxID=1872485 RepID=UPI001B6D8958|nr:MFS transporter [Amaricoccus sp.]MBP7002418.1 MFS transporter [Amaricoccus sp.]